MERQNNKKKKRENGQKDLQNTTHKPKSWATQILLNPMVKAVDQEKKTAPVPLVAPIVLASYVKSVFLWSVVL